MSIPPTWEKLGRLRPPFLSRQPCARNLPVRFGGLPLLPRLNHAAPYSFGVPNREDIAMARTAPEKSNFFVRCNYNVGAPGEAQKAAVGQEQSVKAATQKALALRYATDGLLALIESAIARVEQGDQAEAALRELWASLLEIKALRARDPGIRMAVQDVYEAAAALSTDTRVVDIRRWRLLKEAQLRLRRRLED
jgi:hypothetical protein